MNERIYVIAGDLLTFFRFRPKIMEEFRTKRIEYVHSTEQLLGIRDAKIVHLPGWVTNRVTDSLGYQSIKLNDEVYRVQFVYRTYEE
jgi:hypothetical protein